jgi:AcrR family transcriptional regulator
MSPTHLIEAVGATTPLPAARRARILASAAHAFSANGFKGASLRDIASDAAVSLTLVDHYFGSKEQLLSAVVANHHEVCKKRMAGLRAALDADGRPASLAQLTQAWVRHEFELYDSEDSADYLLFLVKLMNDPHVSATIQRDLDCSEPVILHALALAAPTSTETDRQSAFSLARSALHAAILDCSVAPETGELDEIDIAIDFGSRFILGGLRAALA